MLMVAVSVFAENKAWHDDFEIAAALAKKENKPMLLNFSGSDWCTWCKRLSKEVFTKDEFLEYAGSDLVLVLLDFPKFQAQDEKIKAQNNALAQKYGIRGFPTVILLDSGGKLVAQTGYQAGGAASYVTYLKKLLAVPEEG